MSKKLTRREMLKVSGAFAAASVLLASCKPEETPTPTEEVAVQPTAKPVAGNVVVLHFLHEFTEDHVAAFEEANPGITVEVGDASDATRFYAMYAAGTPPDLYRLQAPSIPMLLARKMLYDLTPYFEASELIKIDDLAPANDYYKAESPLKVGTGKIYGMCKDFSPDFTIFVNTELIANAGLPPLDDTKAMTYDEIMANAEKTTIFEGDRLVQLGYGYEAGWMDRHWMNMLAELGQSLYSEGYDKIVISSNEEAVKAVKWFYDMAEKKVAPSPRNPSPNGWFGTDFTANIMAMAQYGFWYSAMAESDQNRGHIAMHPGPTWSGVRRDVTMTATGMIMTSASQNPDAAWKVFEFYNAGAPSVERAGSGWGVPALKSQWPLIPQTTDFQKQAYRVLQGELALVAPPLQFNPFVGETVVPDSWAKNLDQALNGDITFDEMVANIESEVNLSIKDAIDRMS
jgi:multiple sugar transport system substrate-binding protein